ncbi:sulfotransferase [Halobacillus andaensis]|uniref:Sulfotransferase n=1 Tax=Halobacillus andaensis TaxID=1176239 RepID=A0A917B5P9_HALAA|nr:sulfotransferase domain-containing protein [Halobacillus andaensis]MBP2004306.1 hypothetical protein [Halobacillus andaensis]GGF22659.1 sulfotransferase [Halobacillus andaensis]
MSGPNFIGVGGMKCATTWISECLRYHPEIFISQIKEIHYFSRHYKNGYNWYIEKNFKGSENYKAVGEFSTSYLDDEFAPERIYNSLGEVKIVISLRNPIERFISHYKHIYRNEDKGENLNISNINIENYQRAIKLYPELLEKGEYYNQLMNYIEIFGESNIHIILKDDIDREPQTVLEDLYNFLEVKSNYVAATTNKEVSIGIVPKYYKLEKIRVTLYKFMKRNAPWVILLIRKIRLGEMYRKLNKKNENIKVDKRVKKELLNHYRDSTMKTSKLLNKNLDHWLKI